VLIRRELDPDRAAVRRVHTAAFPTTLESDLLDALRTDAGWLPRFSLVAELDGAVVGHVVGTRAWVFVAATELAVVSPDPTWGTYFQARRLTDGAPRGQFRYAAPLNQLV
jgi:predicted N-acetyltransferase YhbS